jgi:Fe-S-cluster containining protein
MQTIFTGKRPLPVPPTAKKSREKIFKLLTALESSGAGSCLEPEFKTTWAETLGLIDKYQEEIARSSNRKVSCRKGCAACCCHWVEDVNSFEAEIMAEYIAAHVPVKIQLIRAQCLYNEEMLKKLNDIVETKMSALASREPREKIDPVDLLLASFYRLRIRCPLLENGVCLAYPVRPLTCRMYVSFSSPRRCDPAYIDEGDIPTYLFDLEEDADGIIDRLHFKFLKFENDTGLQSQLAKYLG